MIDLTVKTLDSQNHSFSVPDDTTVKQLKEKIAESISFPVDSQRLIYCGRVLQDDKNLSEYDVNGKVIHLVQRPPPSARPNGSQSSTRTGSQPRRTNHHFRQSRLDGNAMYLGAMAFPADLMDAQGIQAPPPSHNLSMSRLELARRMLRRARVALNRLENPRPAQEGTDTDSPPEETETASSSNGENSNSANVSSTSGGPTVVPFSGSIAQAAQAATAAAIAAAVSAAHAASVSNITIVRGGDQPGDVQIEDHEVTISTSEDGAAPGTDTPMQDASPPEAQPAASESGTTASSEERPQRTQEPPRTTTMADLLDELGTVNRRLQPFLTQYHQLMRDDPVFEPNSPAIRESQRVFRLVSEIMHYLSHAYHALSDTMCDFSQAPPRLLRCRPVLIQHSAVLQAGIPIQAQINVMANRGNSSASSNTNNTEQENTSRSTTNGPATTETAEENAPTPPPTVSSTTESNQTQGATQEQRPRAQETTFNIAPGNVEFFMEVGPGSITIDSLEATVVTNGNASGGGSGGVEANVIGGGFPWGNPAPPEFIQNLMHAVAGHMIGRGAGPQNGNPQAATTTSSSATTTVTAGGAGAGVGTVTGQNSQARVNTATHPTTATQTRSTSRPHVHLAPTMQRRARLRRGRRIHFHVLDGTDFDPPPGLAASNFDPFLPCNSHHLRSGGRLNLHPFQQHFIANLESQAPSSSSSTAAAAANQGEETRSTTPPGAPSEENSRPQAAEQPTSSQEATAQQAPSQTQQQASPQQPTQQASTQQEARSPTDRQNLLDLISTLFNNLPPSPSGTSISFGNLVQIPPRPPASNPPRSTTANTAPPTLPPGMALFLNMANGQDTAGAGETNLFNMPMMAQMFEGLSDVLSGAFQGQAQRQGSTIADFLQTLPDHSYTEGSYLFLDLMMTLARCMTFQDIIALSLGNVDSLNRIRPQLRQFVSERLLENESMSGDTVARGVDKLLREIRPYLDAMLEARLREDVDLITSIIRYNQIRLPEAIQLIMHGGNESTFGRQMAQWCQTYIRELTGIVRYCCLDDLQGINTIIRNYVQQLTRGINPALQMWTVNSSLSNLQSLVSSQNATLEDIQQFLVYRIPSSSPPEEQVHSEPVHQEPKPEPMEMDSSIGEPQASSLVYHAEPISSPLSMDTESLPDVVLGSEAWHNVLPSDWVPIITRDTQRQRRQSSQAPFSDAYLSGMPSKRRKIVAAAKPQGNMNQVITEGVRRSVDAASVRPLNGIEDAGEDIELQAAYREDVRSTVEQRLASSSELAPERFPNTTKYFK